jgi:hypothetical protein
VVRDKDLKLEDGEAWHTLSRWSGSSPSDVTPRGWIILEDDVHLFSRLSMMMDAFILHNVRNN